MKKLFAGILIALASFSVMAQHHGYRPSYRHHHHYAPSRSYNWVSPLIIGGAVGYALTRPPVVVEQPPVIVSSPPVQNTDEIVYINGRYYRRDVVMINGVWQEVLIPQ